MNYERKNTLLAFLLVASMLFGMSMAGIGESVAMPTQTIGFITTPATNGTVGFTYTYSPSIGRSLAGNESFGTQELPSWATFTGTSISGTPHAPGSYDFRITCSRYIFINAFPNPYSILTTFAYQNWTVTVSTINEFMSSPPLTGTIGFNYTYTPVLNPSVPSLVTIGAMVLPSWATYDGTIVTGFPTQGGNYSFSLAANQYVYTGIFPNPYAILNTFQYQNWTVTVGSNPIPSFINQPANPTIMNTSGFFYHIETSIPSNITILGAPSWLHLVDGNLTGKSSSIGRYRVIIYAVSIQYNTTNTNVFDIVIPPVIWPSVPVASVWNTMIPVFFLVIIMIISAISPAGISKDVFMYSGAIGITLLVWSGSFPMWALVIPAIILVVQFYQTRVGGDSA
jgi:hypothetical protein